MIINGSATVAASALPAGTRGLWPPLASVGSAAAACGVFDESSGSGGGGGTAAAARAAGAPGTAGAACEEGEEGEEGVAACPVRKKRTRVGAASGDEGDEELQLALAMSASEAATQS